MFRKLLIGAMAAFSLAASTAPALAAHQAATTDRQATIPFVDLGGIRDWRADGTSGVWIQDAHRQWYHATLMQPAFDLPFVEHIGFATGPISTLDRFSSIVVRGQSYPLASLVKSDAPPAKR
ncbi:DUF6491 family protein [Sphingomonas colocasiae]|uniref:DUF6491 family protein n=1 Tax=Sphingomonas colocasiae TaxID=1848973 RepID=A0ABS7PMR5_9SPHN|nr:DUF6491 family protein [Sphingomonas colocasiae]MBY8822605.1 DUF6491 family protein [Sphingomonas colocasiae]